MPAILTPELLLPQLKDAWMEIATLKAQKVALQATADQKELEKQDMKIQYERQLAAQEERIKEMKVSMSWRVDLTQKFAP